MNKPATPPKKVTFTDAKEGDRVWSLTEGWGVVKNRYASRTTYPLNVKFEKGCYRTYTLWGMLHFTHINPTLFWDEVKIETPEKPLPQLEVDAKVVVWVSDIPAPNKLNLDREQVTEVEAPSHSLPDWSECNLRVGNSEWLKDNDRKPEHDSLTANPLHEFIYEYDDSDAYKSAWFLHRLEKLIGFIKSEQVPTSDVAKLVEALEGFLAIVSESSGVAGYHLNGDIAKWGEFEEVAMAEEALAIYHKRGDL